jgi:hypothetical protein
MLGLHGMSLKFMSVKELEVNSCRGSQLLSHSGCIKFRVVRANEGEKRAFEFEWWKRTLQ